MSGLMNKVKDALSGEHNTSEARAANQGSNDYDNTTGSGSSLTGTGSHHTGVTTGTTGSGLPGAGSHNIDGTSVTTGSGGHSCNYDEDDVPDTIGSGLAGGSGYGSTNVGPHSSNLANKADPRVDSDMDGSRSISGTTGQGYGSSAGGATGSTGLTHDSSMRSTGVTGTGAHHGHHHGHHHEDIVHGGAHHSSTANRLDPNVPGTGTDALGAGTQSSGSAGNNTTAGPHKSAILNKLDPRVDSDLDGSKTIGGNKTYTDSSNTSTMGSNTTGTGSNTVGMGSSNTGLDSSISGHSGISSSTSAMGDPSVGQGQTIGSPNTSSEPLDAAKHTPSQFSAVHGDPIIAHDDTTHDRLGRHGSKVGDDLAKYGGGHQ